MAFLVPCMLHCCAFEVTELKMQIHGRDWKQLGRAVPNKTETQIKNYFQNYKAKVWQYSCLLHSSLISSATYSSESRTSPGACLLF